MTFIQETLKFFNLDNLEKKCTSHNITKKILPSDEIAFFKNGQLFATQPTHLENWYDVKYICSDGVFYNLEDIYSIKQIAIPAFKPHDIFNDYGSNGSLDYVLRMKAGAFYDRKQKDLCSACLWKATELMLHNDFFLWREQDYYRIVQWHIELGMFEEADKAEYYLYTRLRKNKPYQQLISSIKDNPEYQKQQKEFFFKNQARKEYYKLVYLLPDIAPKSFSAYRRMKNQNSPRFLEIKRIAEENGIIILLDTSKKEPDKRS